MKTLQLSVFFNGQYIDRCISIDIFKNIRSISTVAHSSLILGTPSKMDWNCIVEIAALSCFWFINENRYSHRQHLQSRKTTFKASLFISNWVFLLFSWFKQFTLPISRDWLNILLISLHFLDVSFLLKSNTGDDRVCLKQRMVRKCSGFSTKTKEM